MVINTIRQGVVGRAISRGIIQLQTWNPRDYTQDVHRTVDDRPYGGGPGMLLKVEPLVAALQAAKESYTATHASDEVTRCIYLSPQGRTISQKMLREAASWPRLTLVCGRYEGVDERVIASEVDEEWSLGDFVLSGGEIAAAAVVDGISRLIPGVLGHGDSAQNDSHESGLLDCAHYTRPENYRGMSVPAVLLSGDHERIRRWRLEQSLLRTLERRPDMLSERQLSEEEYGILRQIKQKRH